MHIIRGKIRWVNLIPGLICQRLWHVRIHKRWAGNLCPKRHYFGLHHALKGSFCCFSPPKDLKAKEMIWKICNLRLWHVSAALQSLILCPLIMASQNDQNYFIGRKHATSQIQCQKWRKVLYGSPDRSMYVANSNFRWCKKAENWENSFLDWYNAIWELSIH